MPRILPSNSLSAAIRAHFGLTQTELGHYLGVRREQVAFVEAGQRGFSLAAERRLRPLGLLLPESLAGAGPPGPLAPEPVAPAAAPDLAALRKRLRRCRHQAARLRYELENEDTRAEGRANRQRGLAQLRAGLLPAASAGSAATAEAEHTRRWLAQLAADAPAASPGPTARALGAARLRGLLAEAEALEALVDAVAAKASDNHK